VSEIKPELLLDDDQHAAFDAGRAAYAAELRGQGKVVVDHELANRILIGLAIAATEGDRAQDRAACKSDFQELEELVRVAEQTRREDGRV
jgi:hypothetical protein